MKAPQHVSTDLTLEPRWVAALSDPEELLQLSDKDEHDDSGDDSDSGDDGDNGSDGDSGDDGDAPPPSSKPPAAFGDDPSPSAHDDSHDHGLAHVTPVNLLVGVLGALLLLTVATVLVTKVDLGSQYNLVVAMVIATIKAGLVITYFMHLRWDRKFNLIVFLSSVLFLILFLSMTLADRAEYQPLIDQAERDQAAQTVQ